MCTLCGDGSQGWSLQGGPGHLVTDAQVGTRALLLVDPEGKEDLIETT